MESRRSQQQMVDHRRDAAPHHTTAPVERGSFDPVLDLQQTIGNQSVLRLIRAKLKLSNATDPHERDADQVADKVAASVQSHDAVDAPGSAVAMVRRKPDGPGGISMPSLQLGPGFELDASTRAAMEPHFGADFSSVRVHTGAEADKATEALGARAFTLGQSMAFGRAEYAPNTGAGRKLIAHELAHVVSPASSSDGSPVLQRSPDADTETTSTLQVGSSPLSGVFALSINEAPQSLRVSLDLDPSVTSDDALEQEIKLILAWLSVHPFSPEGGNLPAELDRLQAEQLRRKGEAHKADKRTPQALPYEAVSLDSEKELKAILSRPVPVGSTRRRDELMSFFSSVSINEASRLLSKLSNTKDPDYLLMSRKVHPSTIPKVLEILRLRSFGQAPRHLPERLTDEALLDEFLNTAAADLPEKSTSFEDVFEEERSTELYAEAASRGIAFSRPDPYTQNLMDLDLSLDQATQRFNYSGIDLEHLTSKFEHPSTTNLGGRAVGYYRILEKASDNQLYRVNDEVVKQLKPDIKSIIAPETIDAPYVDQQRKVLVIRYPTQVELKTNETREFVFEIWWFGDGDAEFNNCLVAGAEMAAQYKNASDEVKIMVPETGDILRRRLGVLMRPLVGDAILFDQMKREAVSMVASGVTHHIANTAAQKVQNWGRGAGPTRQPNIPTSDPPSPSPSPKPTPPTAATPAADAPVTTPPTRVVPTVPTATPAVDTPPPVTTPPIRVVPAVPPAADTPPPVTTPSIRVVPSTPKQDVKATPARRVQSTKLPENDNALTDIDRARQKKAAKAGPQRQQTQTQNVPLASTGTGDVAPAKVIDTSGMQQAAASVPVAVKKGSTGDAGTPVPGSVQIGSGTASSGTGKPSIGNELPDVVVTARLGDTKKPSVANANMPTATEEQKSTGADVAPKVTATQTPKAPTNLPNFNREQRTRINDVEGKLHEHSMSWNDLGLHDKDEMARFFAAQKDAEAGVRALEQRLRAKLRVAAVQAEAQQPQAFQSRKEGVLPSRSDPDVPEGQRMPLGTETPTVDKGGFWGGERGNSEWFSDVEALNKVTGYKPVEFRNGYPDFSPWAKERVRVPITGIDSTDFAAADKLMAPKRGFANQTAYKEWRKANRLTWHHVEGADEMILVPRDMHGNVPHIGGASEARGDAAE